MPMRQTQDGWEFEVDPGMGPSKVQVFKGKTQEEVFQAIERAQINATQRIGTLSSYLQPDPGEEIPEFKPRTIGTDEMVQLGAEMNDPTKAVGAVNKIIEATLGAKPDELRKALRSVHVNRLVAKYKAITDEWMRENPEFRRTPRNHQAMMTWLDSQEAIEGKPETRGLPPTKKNLTLGFNALKEIAGGLPDGLNVIEEGEQPENAAPGNEGEGGEHIAPANGERRIASQPQPATRPRGPEQSSSLRNRDASGTRTPTTRAAKWTKQQVRDMSDEAYDKLIKEDPAFKKWVDEGMQATA